MPSETIPVSAAPREQTFKKYTATQGQTYARYRPGYHPALYEQILAHHKATGGQTDSLLDVGCGPGTAVQALAPHFAHATGFDPSEGMVESARAEAAAWATATGEPVHFQVTSAEELGGLPDASVDLLTAASAAHWFDMASFWPRAARVMRPGGTVAFCKQHPVFSQWPFQPLMLPAAFPSFCCSGLRISERASRIPF